MTRPKDKGTAAESMVVRYLQRTFWPHAERRALSGGKDKGDITGTPGLAWEVKAAKTHSVPKWLRETEAERDNANADFGILVIKPNGVGAENTSKFFALMEAKMFNILVRDLTINQQVEAYTWQTTIRKHNLPIAAGLTRQRKPNTVNWWWCNYPDFTLTDLSQMVGLLVMAGYGSPVLFGE